MAQQIGPGFPALQAAVDLYKRLAAHGAAQVQDPRDVLFARTSFPREEHRLAPGTGLPDGAVILGREAHHTVNTLAAGLFQFFLAVVADAVFVPRRRRQGGEKVKRDIGRLPLHNPAGLDMVQLPVIL